MARRLISLLILINGVLISCNGSELHSTPVYHPEMFKADRAFQDVAAQLEFGPRFPESEGHGLMREWLLRSLELAGWQPKVLESRYREHTIFNIETCRNLDAQSAGGFILLGAHYDTRLFADRDPDPEKREDPVPGANDGASGVAVLLEVARVLPENFTDPICLVFFDAEDNGRILDWDWIVGSRLYVEQLTSQPSAVVIVDMVGDYDQHFPVEQNSDPGLVTEIWGTAEKLGIGSFSPEEGYSILDDHTPFIQNGIPAIDIIDFDYPYWHTTSDTLEHVSGESLKNVGDVLLAWLLGE